MNWIFFFFEKSFHSTRFIDGKLEYSILYTILYTETIFRNERLYIILRFIKLYSSYKVLCTLNKIISYRRHGGLKIKKNK